MGVRTRPFLQQNRMSWQIHKTFACFESPSLISSSVKLSSLVTIQDTRLKSIVGIIDATYSFEQSSVSGVNGIISVNCNCCRRCLPNKYALCIGLLVGLLVEISVNSSSTASSSKACSMSLQLCTTFYIVISCE